MKLGAEPKKVAILGALVVVAIIVFLMNSSSDGPSRSSAPVSSPAPSAAGIRLPSQQSVDVPLGRPVSASPSRTSGRQGRVLSDFKPTLKPKRPEDRPDPMTVDPTIRVDVLAKLQAVNVEGVHRSVFEFTQPPPPPTPVVDPKKKPIVPTASVLAQTQQQAQPSTPPPPPPPPPIPLKFYGYVTPSSAGGKRAFFLEGEDIHVVNEGDLVKKRYKIVRIGINSVVVEDTQFKNQQTLPLEEQPG